MKVRLDLPDWVDERHIRIKADERNDIHVLAGVELVAIKYQLEDHWLVKDQRCNMCGDCCTGLPTTHVYPTVNGECIHLGKPDRQGRRMCQIPLYRSRICDADPPPGKHPRCSITYKKVPCE